MQYLPLQIREVDDIAVYQADGADTRGSEIQSGGRAEPAGADEQNLCLAQLHLAFATDLAENNLAAIPLNLLLSQFHRMRYSSFGSMRLDA
jgi:hypothetical protein